MFTHIAYSIKMQEVRGKLSLVSSRGNLYAVGGVSGFRETDRLDSIERLVRVSLSGCYTS